MHAGDGAWSQGMCACARTGVWACKRRADGRVGARLAVVPTIGGLAGGIRTRLGASSIMCNPWVCCGCLVGFLLAERGPPRPQRVSKSAANLPQRKKNGTATAKSRNGNTAPHPPCCKLHHSCLNACPATPKTPTREATQQPCNPSSC